MLERLSSSERRGTASVFATAFLAFLAWAFPDMSRLITIPGAIVCAALAIYFLWPEIVALFRGLSRREITTERIMSAADVAYNVGIGATVITILAALWRGRGIAIVAALIALIVLGIDYWTGPPRGFIFSRRSVGSILRNELHGAPLGWSRLYINNALVSPAGKPVNIKDISILGGNVGTEEN
jgi:hypothetical protein